MRFVLASSHRSRHPLARALSLLLGLAVVGILLVFGLVVAGVLLVGGGVLLALRQWKRSRTIGKAAPRTGDVLEGDFVVIRQGRPVTH